jgi:hypothetical protein
MRAHRDLIYTYISYRYVIIILLVATWIVHTLVSCLIDRVDRFYGLYFLRIIVLFYRFLILLYLSVDAKRVIINQLLLSGVISVVTAGLCRIEY